MEKFGARAPKELPGPDGGCSETTVWQEVGLD